MSRLLQFWFLVFCILVTCGCASRHYERTQLEDLKGKTVVEWRKPNLFAYKPDKEQPVVFVRKSGDTIIPEAMFTDGGSIPRQFWILRNYSPWGYGPAFIVHDWLFHMQNCKKPGYEKYSLEEAATIMSDVMKTMMENPGFDYGSKTAMYSMYKAVQTPSARHAWNEGHCVVPDLAIRSQVPDEVFVVEFPPKTRDR
jgi:Protein of unknown function (DUF1353)